MLRVLGRGAVRRRALSTSSRPEEVRKFSRIGSEWWNPSSRAGAAPLHGFNFARVQHIGKALGSRRLAGVKALDVGCGGGLLSESLARLGCNVRGIDLSEESIAVATAHAAGDPLTRGIQYETRSLEEIVRGAAAGEREGGYDLVCASEVIEHVDSPREFLGALCELVRPGGHLTVSTINRTPQSFALAIVAAEYVTGLIPKGTHNWRQFLTPAEVEEMIREAACSPMKLVLREGILFNPMCNDSRLDSANLSVNYILTMRKEMG